MQPRYIVALEITSSKIKGAIASMPLVPEGTTQPSTLTIEAIEETATTAAAVQYGRIVNIVETAKSASQIIHRLESRPGIAGHIAAVYTSIGGRSLASEKVCDEMVFDNDTVITDDYIAQLRTRACSHVAADREVLSVIPVSYMVDNAPQANPVGAFGHRLSGEFTLVTCNRANKRNLDMVIEEQLKLDVCDYIVCPLAEADLVLTPEERQIGCVFIDLGAETTTVAVYKQSVLRYIATLPLGARNITRDITMGMSITEERAEALKCAVGNAIEETPGLAPGSEGARVNNYVRARIGEIVANISAQISISGFQSEDLPGGCIVVGGGTRLRNFNILLENANKMKVRTGTCGSEFRIADSSISLNDNIDILSIINEAAKTSDYICIETPSERIAERIDTPSNPFTRHDGEDVPYHYDGGGMNIDDPYLLDDDEKIESKRRSDNARAARERDNAERKARAKAEADALRRQRRLDEIKEDAPLDTSEETDDHAEKRSIIRSLRNTVVKIFTVDPAEDSDLDDE